MKKFSVLSVILAFLVFNVAAAGTTVTYEFSGGRFGDSLLAYLHAKWISYKYGVPLLYRPFRYSSDLVLHDRELLYNEANVARCPRITLSADCPAPFFTYNHVFFCPYFPEIPWEFSLSHNTWFSFKVDWKDPKFKKIVRELVAPSKQCTLTFPPKGVISIALHIREGGSFDADNLRFDHPLKVPPLSYYIKALRTVLQFFRGYEIYCYCFTDALDPGALVREIQNHLPKDAPITIDFRRENNHDDKNVIEDFFSLFNFDVLIRAASNYSIVPSLIGDFALIIYPEAFVVDRPNVEITSITFERNNELISELFESRLKSQK